MWRLAADSSRWLPWWRVVRTRRGRRAPSRGVFHKRSPGRQRDEAATGRTVTVHYTGWLYSASAADNKGSNSTRPPPAARSRSSSARVSHRRLGSGRGRDAGRRDAPAGHSAQPGLRQHRERADSRELHARVRRRVAERPVAPCRCTTFAAAPVDGSSRRSSAHSIVRSPRGAAATRSNSCSRRSRVSSAERRQASAATSRRKQREVAGREATAFHEASEKHRREEH